MSTPGSNEFRLVLPGLSTFGNLVNDFLDQALSFAGCSGEELEQIIDAVVVALNLIEDRVKMDDDPALPIELVVEIDPRALDISIVEHGVPLGDRDHFMGLSEESLLHALFDEVHWVQLGTRGSSIHLHRLRENTEITALVDVVPETDSSRLHEVEKISSVSRDVHYTFRRFRAGDEFEVSRQFYQSYGRTYPNPDLLYPERILCMNEQGRLHSIIVECEKGSIAGHYGIERPDLGVVGEAGLAVVDPAHRGHGIFASMRTFLVEEARTLGLIGLWSQPTTRHAYSQKMNIKFGSTLCGLSLATTPASVNLRGNEAEEKAERHSCFLYWLPLGEEPAITASVPDSMASLFGDLYQARARDCRLETALVAPDASEEIAATVGGRFNRARRTGSVTISRIDRMTLPLVRQLVSDLLEISGAEVIYADLPITDRSCAWLAEALLDDDDFVLCGIGPRFIDGEDALRLQRLAVPVDLDELVVEGDLARKMTDFITSSLPM